MRDRKSRIRILVIAVCLVLFAAIGPGSARAQSPTPTWWMGDAYPGGSYPSGANAVVVEGLGGINCSQYSLSQIESATVNWMKSNLQTITEITPQTVCGTVSQYETVIGNLIAYVEAYGNNPGRYWGGIMLDEEAGYGFSASSLEAINTYTQNAIQGTPGLSWYFTENPPEDWSVGTYNSIAENSWLAPQIYNQNDVNSANSACSTYSDCFNDVTVWKNNSNGYPWTCASCVTAKINGTPWSSSYWGNGYWYNMYLQ